MTCSWGRTDYARADCGVTHTSFEYYVMGSGEEYRRFAAECLKLAQQTHDSGRKTALMAMAIAWKRLAEFIESPAILALKHPRTEIKVSSSLCACSESENAIF